MTRLFVAVWPSPAVIGMLAALPREASPGVGWTSPESWHVTLAFLGDADPLAVAARLTALHHDARRTRLGPAVELLGRAVVVPVAGLDPLAAAVARTLHGLGRADGERSFVGHLTIGRRRNEAPCELLGHRLTAEFPVDEVTLVSSRRDADGSLYEVLTAVTLRR